MKQIGKKPRPAEVLAENKANMKYVVKEGSPGHWLQLLVSQIQICFYCFYDNSGKFLLTFLLCGKHSYVQLCSLRNLLNIERESICSSHVLWFCSSGYCHTLCLLPEACCGDLTELGNLVQFCIWNIHSFGELIVLVLACWLPHYTSPNTDPYCPGLAALCLQVGSLL